MTELTAWLVILAAHIKNEPVYSFVLETVPLIIISLLGAMVATLNSDAEITTRRTLAAIGSAIAAGIVTAAGSRHFEIKIPIQVVVALVGGMTGKQFLTVVCDKIINMVKNKNV